MSRELHNEEKKNMSPNNVNEEDVSAGISAHEELSVSGKVMKVLFVEEAAACGSESSGPNTSKDPDVEMDKINKCILSHDHSDNDGPSEVNFETLDKEPTSPAQEDEDTPAAAADDEHKESMQLLQELKKEREEACQLNQQLQMKLAGYFQRRANDDVHQEWSASEQQQEYEKHLRVLIGLKLQLNSASESGQRQAQELGVQAQEKLDQVEKDWQALVALKQDAAEAALSRRLGKEAARAKVRSVLVAEQIQQDELTKVRLKHFKLKLKIHRLEAELRERDKDSRDPLQIRFEQLWAERLKQKQQAEKENEESLKLQKKISSCLELLSNIKEKLFWSQMEVQSKQQHVAEMEAMVAKKKDLLTQTKQDRTRFQRDNLRLKERCGLLGNRVLLQDFEDTVDASEHLEKHLETLKVQQAEAVFKCGRWRKKMETTLIDK